jgi:hypothetical protein
MVLILLAYLGARYEFRDDLLPRIQRQPGHVLDDWRASLTQRELPIIQGRSRRT